MIRKGVAKFGGLTVYFKTKKQNQPMEDEDQREVRFRHITEITILTVQLIVEFAKRLPGFDKLLREDQIALLKVQFCFNEILKSV